MGKFKKKLYCKTMQYHSWKLTLKSANVMPSLNRRKIMMVSLCPVKEKVEFGTSYHIQTSP
jgi:hypothetical protein